MDDLGSQLALHFSASAKSSLALLSPLIWSIALVAGLGFTLYLLRCYAQERRFRRHVARRKHRSREVWLSCLADPGSPRWQEFRAVAYGRIAAELRGDPELENAGANGDSFLRAA